MERQIQQPIVVCFHGCDSFDAKYCRSFLDRTSSETQEKLHDVNQEFVSEDYDTSAVNMEEIRREIEQLTVTKTNSKKDKAGSPGRKELN